VIKPIL